MKKPVVFLILCFIASLFYQAYAMQQYQVKRGDTLWGIATSHRPGGDVSVPTMMDAIRAMNPGLFPKKNSILTIGQEVKLPTSMAEIDKALKEPVTSNSESTAPVAQNNARANKDKSTIVQLQQVASMAQKSVTRLQQENTQLKQQLQEKAIKIVSLTSSLNQAQGKGSFPWAWLWFVLFAIAVGILWYQQRQEQDQPNSGRVDAASRFGLKSEKPENSKKPPKWFTKKKLGYELEKGFVVRPRANVDPNADVITLIDADIKQGNYAAAEKKLKNEIWHNKQNIALRMQLLELYALTDNKREFNKVSEYMLKHLITEDSDEWVQVRKIYLNAWVYD